MCSEGMKELENKGPVCDREITLAKTGTRVRMHVKMGAPEIMGNEEDLLSGGVGFCF